LIRKLLVVATAVVVGCGLVATTGSAAARQSVRRAREGDAHARYGYEPAVYVDNYGNVFATAHKENWQLAIAPDLNSPTFTRSMSWAWSRVTAAGASRTSPGSRRLSFEQHDFGDERRPGARRREPPLFRWIRMSGRHLHALVGDRPWADVA